MSRRQLALIIGFMLASLAVPPKTRAGSPCDTQELDQVFPSDAGGNAGFGRVVAISGDTAVVGNQLVPGNLSGRAYVFVNTAGTWTEQAILIGSDTAAGDRFGTDVAIDGNTIVVGSPDADGPVGNFDGAAYVFVRSGTTWTEQAKLQGSGTPVRLGRSVDIKGNTVIAGAPQGGVGAAYVFTRSGTSWTEQQVLTASDGAAGDDFGTSVALDGDVAAVGADDADGAAGIGQGAAYVFTRTGSTWTERDILIPSDAQAGATFGNAIDVSGDTVLVAAWQHDGLAGATQGHAYIFVRSGNVWNEEFILTASDQNPGDFFGAGVSIDGESVVVGAPNHEGFAGILSGQVYFYLGAGDTWVETEVIVPADNAQEDQFGGDVAIDGELAVIGATGVDDTVGADQGAGYIFRVPDDRNPDGDSAPNCNDGCPTDGNKTDPGVCGCFELDTDTDGDLTPDCNDGCDNDPLKTAPGICGCGVIDNPLDTDTDGTPDCVDGCPLDINKTDPGQCGCGVADDDTDGDGTADCDDNCPADPDKIEPGVCGCGVSDDDSDDDGTEDCDDNCPADENKTEPGECGCGVADDDTDGDGTLDCDDGCPDDANKTEAGECGCGVEDEDSDSDGTLDCDDDCPSDPAKTDPGVCGCGVAEDAADGDGDGVPDCADECPEDFEKSEEGVCGCGEPETDTDSDGVVDCLDNCPEDVLKTEPGDCGCGVPDTDVNNNDVPDCEEESDFFDDLAGFICGIALLQILFPLLLFIGVARKMRWHARFRR